MAAFSFVALAAVLLPSIVGGTPVPAGAHAEALALAGEDGNLICTLSLVAPRVALTAAHCVEA